MGLRCPSFLEDLQSPQTARGRSTRYPTIPLDLEDPDVIVDKYMQIAIRIKLVNLKKETVHKYFTKMFELNV